MQAIFQFDHGQNIQHASFFGRQHGGLDLPRLHASQFVCGETVEQVQGILAAQLQMFDKGLIRDRHSVHAGVVFCFGISIVHHDVEIPRFDVCGSAPGGVKERMNRRHVVAFRWIEYRVVHPPFQIYF